MPERFLQAVQELPSSARRGLARGLAAVARAMGVSEELPALFFEDPPDARARGKRRDR